MMRKAWRSIEEVPYCFSRSPIKFQGYMGKKIDNLIPILSKITRLVAAIKSPQICLFGYYIVFFMLIANAYHELLNGLLVFFILIANAYHELLNGL